MGNQYCHKRVLLWLATLLLTLPILAWGLVGVGGLLEAMGDQAGRVLFIRLAAACAALWIVDLVACVVVLAIAALSEQHRQSSQPPDVRDAQAEE